MTLDNTPPAASLFEIHENSAYAHTDADSVYYGDDGGGTFELRLSAADATSGLDRAEFPFTVSGGGTYHTALSGAYQYAHAYDFSGAATQGSYDVRVYDRAGNYRDVPFSVVRDTAPPVVSLQANANGASISVNWGGTTDAGAGISHYDVAVSIDGGDWTPWLGATTDTSATYDGEPGHQYAFQVTATDNVGNAASAEAEATTRHIVKYYYFSGQRVAMRGPDGAVTWLHGDHLGSTSLAIAQHL